MKIKTFYFIIFKILFVTLFCKAQFVLQPAFPNLQSFSSPVELVTANDGTNRFFIVQRLGKIYVFNNSPTVTVKKNFIDLTSKVSQSNIQTGLFGLAFHPDYENNQYFYVNYVFDSAGSPTGRWLRVSRYTANSSNPDTALINTELILLSQPILAGGFHNGGKLDFGPDGYLYISFGDGPPVGPSPAQDKTNLPGKVLRIDVDSTSAGKSYSIPPTNPFYGNILGYREEIYAYGFRNLFKFSFDPQTNLLWGGDVGQGSYEEIDLIENGKNYGWDKMEGFHCFPPNSCDTTGKGFTRPIFEYRHVSGNYAIIGGYVYRGALHPDLYGKYIYADEVKGIIWALSYDGINPPTNIQLLDTTFDIVTFGQDESNEIYVSTYSTGKIYKLINNSIITLGLKTAIQGFYDSTNTRLNMRDTMNIYLRSVNTPYTIVDSSKTVIDSLSLTGFCFFKNAPKGKYYIMIKHRNAVETWSRNGGDSLLKGDLMNYDFTTDISKAFGNNMNYKGVYCIFSGDVNQDGNVDVLDNGLTDNDAFNFVTGYVKTDVNGNNVVDVNDLAIIDNNAYNFVSKITPP